VGRLRSTIAVMWPALLTVLVLSAAMLAMIGWLTVWLCG